jgi:F0F1-type ATP synthase assembly protein I
MDKLYQPTEDERKEWDDCDGESKQTRAQKEYDRYTKTQSDLAKSEAEAEKSFDTLLVTIATVAIGASFTLLKDVVKGTNAWIIVAWLLLGLCVVGSLVDRLYTYQFHKKWKKQLDDVFNNYGLHCGHAWKEAMYRFSALRTERIWKFFPAEKFLHFIKWFNGVGLVFGILALMIYVYAGAGPSSQPTATSAPGPVVVNVYTASTQPTTKPSP